MLQRLTLTRMPERALLRYPITMNLLYLSSSKILLNRAPHGVRRDLFYVGDHLFDVDSHKASQKNESSVTSLSCEGQQIQAGIPRGEHVKVPSSGITTDQESQGLILGVLYFPNHKCKLAVVS